VGRSTVFPIPPCLVSFRLIISRQMVGDHPFEKNGFAKNSQLPLCSYRNARTPPVAIIPIQPAPTLRSHEPAKSVKPLDQIILHTCRRCFGTATQQISRTPCAVRPIPERSPSISIRRLHIAAKVEDGRADSCRLSEALMPRQMVVGRTALTHASPGGRIGVSVSLLEKGNTSSGRSTLWAN
jgi:hypothetical protein